MALVMAVVMAIGLTAMAVLALVALAVVMLSLAGLTGLTTAATAATPTPAACFWSHFRDLSGAMRHDANTRNLCKAAARGRTRGSQHRQARAACAARSPAATLRNTPRHAIEPRGVRWLDRSLDRRRPSDFSDACDENARANARTDAAVADRVRHGSDGVTRHNQGHAAAETT
jgi:hypothetical protein